VPGPGGGLQPRQRRRRLGLGIVVVVDRSGHQRGKVPARRDCDPLGPLRRVVVGLDAQVLDGVGIVRATHVGLRRSDADLGAPVVEAGREHVLGGDRLVHERAEGPLGVRVAARGGALGPRGATSRDDLAPTRAHGAEHRAQTRGKGGQLGEDTARLERNVGVHPGVQAGQALERGAQRRNIGAGAYGQEQNKQKKKKKKKKKKIDCE
jgi:hypothetical protein